MILTKSICGTNISIDLMPVALLVGGSERTSDDKKKDVQIFCRDLAL